MTKPEFLLLLDEVIEVDPGTLKGDEVLSEMEQWDSLAILGFIALVDEQFDIEMSARRLAGCRTVDDLIGLLGDKISP